MLAIDGGNSKTEVALVAADGTLLASGRGPGANQEHVGIDGAMRILGEIITDVAGRAGLAPGGLVATHTSSCLAGADLPEEEEQLAAALQRQGWSLTSAVANDTFAVLRAGLTPAPGQPAWGVAVTCGAGVNCVGLAPDGRTTRFLALGRLTGDWGGGYYLGQEVMWWSMRAEDGRGRDTALRPAAAAYFGLPTVRDVAIAIHVGRIAKPELIGLTTVLFEAASAGDEVAQGLLERLAEEVAVMALTAMRRLGLADPETQDAPGTPVVLGGGLLAARHPLLTAAIERRIAATAPGAVPRVTDIPPVVGAALLGLDYLGADPDAERRLRAVTVAGLQGEARKIAPRLMSGRLRDLIYTSGSPTHRTETAMTGTAGLCGFVVSADRTLAQITLRGRPTGAAGGATVAPRPGVELAFDRAGGWLSRVIVAATQHGGVMTAGKETVTWIASVFGAATAETVRKVPDGEIRCPPLRPRQETLSALSLLARLDAARVTSPVPGSPLWVAEAADLASRAGLPVPSLALSPPSVPVAGSGNLGSTIPADVMRLLADDARGPCATASTRRPEAFLDLGFVPHEVFRPGLWPGLDLDVRVHGNSTPRIAVEAALLPGAMQGGLADCRVRLVDAGARRVLAVAAFRAGSPSLAWAELPAPACLRALARSGLAWVEVVGDRWRPVQGTRLRRMRRALRWADAALRAESRPNGLAPELTDEQWNGLASLAWDRCQANWEAAGDLSRASLAATRRAAIRGTRRAHPFLAELVRDPASGGD